ncbi:M28 family metallopeptidase [Carboxylicivirga marina]|uniref:M20/M25/M40 family metallo-hydrolase n=1 Tax=Carboxylicivirga marina TaxID=2800988 RepID=A0ABS1HM81_9BACT|nr:M20/M25/M40 family metallo-hydrolase [Carboxylicivirga marina]MBK3518781.1 M20/M25/M40 family metallo-hydrolase [Carboxylicivirga marina]
MNRYFSLVLFLAFTILKPTYSQDEIEKALKTINQSSLQAELTFLSSDWFEGREACTRGAYMAADYLASLYQSSKLAPFNEHSYFQDVPLLIASQPIEATISMQNELLSKTYSFPTHFRAERITESFNVDSEIIWGGFGINDDNFKEINLKNSKGKILIRLSGLPQTTENSQLKELLDSKNTQQWHQVKSDVLKKSGVVAVFEYDLSNPYLKESFENTEILEAPTEKELNKRSSGIYKKNLFLPDDKKNSPYYYKVSKALLSDLIPNFDQFIEKYLSDIQNLKTTAQLKTNYNSIELNAKANVSLKKCRNVIAVIEGSEKPDEIIVVGAHYDHLGSYDGYIWNGADDNGSGAIGTVAIARAFMETGIQPKRTVIFCNWTAEERGLLGSRFFVNTFKDIHKVIYYHNYDMIGRSYNYEQADSAVTLLYTKSWPQAEELCKTYNDKYQLGLKINYSAWDNPTSGSDNAPFAKKGIPIMWFHTGGHESYHMPSDHVDRIDWQKFEAIVKTSFLSLWNLANE